MTTDKHFQAFISIPDWNKSGSQFLFAEFSFIYAVSNITAVSNIIFEEVIMLPEDPQIQNMQIVNSFVKFEDTVLSHKETLLNCQWAKS